MIEIITKSTKETKKVGEALAQELVKSTQGSRALVIALEGELGGGKTTFIQGFAKGLGIKRRITSPTFVLMRKYSLLGEYTFRTFYHIDCYRINNIQELFDLGFKEIRSNPQNIIIIEWADRVRRILPRGRIMVKFWFVDERRRRIVLNFQLPIFNFQ